MKKYLLCAIMSLILFSCNNDLEENSPSDISQNSGQKFQVVIGETEYMFENKDQLKIALDEMRKTGETLKSLKIMDEISLRSSTASTFTFSDGTTEKTYNIVEGGATRYSYIDVNVISTINGSKAGFKMFDRSLWAMVMEYENYYTVDSRRLVVNENVSGGDRTGLVLLEQIGTGKLIVVNVVQKGSPKSNIFHSDGVKEIFLNFGPEGGTLIIPNITSTINGANAGYASSVNNYIENKLYPNWLSIVGFGANKFAVTVKPDQTLTYYSGNKAFAFGITQKGSYEDISISITQNHCYSNNNHVTGGYFPR